jgi:hypothetical protein
LEGGRATVVEIGRRECVSRGGKKIKEGVRSRKVWDRGRGDRWKSNAKKARIQLLRLRGCIKGGETKGREHTGTMERSAEVDAEPKGARKKGEERG